MARKDSISFAEAIASLSDADQATTGVLHEKVDAGNQAAVSKLGSKANTSNANALRVAAAGAGKRISERMKREILRYGPDKS